MFTGLVQHVGRVTSVATSASGVELLVDAAGWRHDPTLGESIAVNGCCLTVANDQPAVDHLRFDVIHQTLRTTALGNLVVDSRVNLEASVTPTTLLGGHIVQGHVDGLATIAAIDQAGGEHRVRLVPPKHLMQWIIAKGSVALDGVSLTVASREEDSFEVALIPTTLQETTLGDWQVGDQVNIEADYVAKIVAQQAQTLLRSQR